MQFSQSDLSYFQSQFGAVQQAALMKNYNQYNGVCTVTNCGEG